MRGVFLFILMLYTVIPAEYWGAIRIIMDSNHTVITYGLLIVTIKMIVGGAVGYFTAKTYLGDK